MRFVPVLIPRKGRPIRHDRSRPLHRVTRNPATYEHVSPEVVDTGRRVTGNHRPFFSVFGCRPRFQILSARVPRYQKLTARKEKRMAL